MNPLYVSIANVIIDDVLLADGQMFLGLLGGSGSHALAGAHVWNDRLGLAASVGADFPAEQRAQLGLLGIDLTGLIVTGAKTARAWQIFQPDETRIEVFREAVGNLAKQTPAFSSLPDSYLTARGYHIYWDGSLPDLQQQIAWLRARNPTAPLVWEPAERNLKDRPEDFRLVLPQVDVFSPNELEAGQITGQSEVSQMMAVLLDWGAPLVAIRQGARGSVLGNQAGDRWTLPAFPAAIVDVTGAGNAYCGGLAVGLGEGKDVGEAAVMAGVSASFALQQYGPASFAAAQLAERESRAAWITARLERTRCESSGAAPSSGAPVDSDLPSLDTAWQVLERIANTLAPGQTLAYTRAPVIQSLLAQMAEPGYTFIPDYQNSGNAVLYWGTEFPRQLFFAHGDQISFLVGPQEQADRWRLIANCSFLSRVDVPGVGLRYDPPSHTLRRAAEGFITSAAVDGHLIPYFRLTQGELLPGDRVVYDLPLQREPGDMVRGNLDNAFGVAALILAASAYSRTKPSPEVGFVFTDVEEGSVQHPVSFSRGARRLLYRIPAPDLCVLVDGHPNDPHEVGDGALFTETSGQGAAGITPPHIYARLQQMAAELRAQGVRFHENRGKVSRGDEIALIEATQNTVMLGYPATDRHFDQGAARGSLQDLRHLAQAVHWIAAHIDELRK
jgi:ribokinase